MSTWLIRVLAITSIFLREKNSTSSEKNQHAVQSNNKKWPPSHRYNRYNHPTEKEHRTAEQFSWRNSFRINVITVIAAICAAGFAYGGFMEAGIQANEARIANQMNTESGRAWLGTTGAAINNPMVNQPISVSIKYQNTGKEPAQEHLIGGTFHTFTAEQWENGEAWATLQNYRNACFGIFPETVGGISFPSNGNGQYALNLISINKFKPESNILVTDNIIQGRVHMTVSGCFAYVTASRKRHTSFCYMYDPKIFDPPKFAILHQRQ